MKYLSKYPLTENNFPFNKEEEEEKEEKTEPSEETEEEETEETKTAAKPAAKSTSINNPFKSSTTTNKNNFQHLSTDTEISNGNLASTIKLNSTTLEPEDDLSDEGASESEPSSTIKLEKEPGDDDHNFSDEGTDGSKELEKDANLFERKIVSFNYFRENR